MKNGLVNNFVYAYNLTKDKYGEPIVWFQEY